MPALLEMFLRRGNDGEQQEFLPRLLSSAWCMSWGSRCPLMTATLMTR
eukprot:CAMPEP_0179121150 /NCGR_PEP_ID=MMETSP0796-20121207/57117_1 /TAXON_ID=73915 /ORGANISM="Pyrodinium bahamense, Strain pbaha01" /LENGTH=47 /DNA_ID= /DNA_START= /DNA_END= /DNA_ORIENTATION=